MSLPPTAEHVLRELAPRVLGAVMRRCHDFAAAEDAVQEALLSAVAEWPERGVPQNPGGWMFRVAWRKLADQQRSERTRQQREVAVASSLPQTAQPATGGDEPMIDSEDDTLLLLFTCCHPALTKPSNIALTLRAVGGLTTAEIASAFLVPEATMAQRISRAKQAIQSAGATFAMPGPEEQEQRLSAVLHVLYLIFNEGYASSSGPDLVRVELGREAIRLSRALLRVRPHHPETEGLLALMLLTDARRSARTGPGGELVPLAEQDRSRWDGAAIAEGTSLVKAALSRGAVGSYQIQAAIAALHDEAPSVDRTDWPQILSWYGLLRRVSDNPVVAVNEAVAAAMVHGPQAGLKLIDQCAADPRLARSHRLDAVRAHLHERAGDRAAAIRHYLAAAGATASLPERQYLLSKAAALREP
jgi:RNA polymerase sigma factor (sigma-70 family)